MKSSPKKNRIVVLGATDGNLRTAVNTLVQFPNSHLVIIDKSKAISLPLRMTNPSIQKSLMGQLSCNSGKDRNSGEITFFTSTRIEQIDFGKKRIDLSCIDTGKPSEIEFDQLIADDSDIDFFRSDNSEAIKSSHEIIGNAIKGNSFELKKPLEMFTRLHIETHAFCNRKCFTCIRQNDPLKTRWNNGKKIENRMSLPLIFDILEQARRIGFNKDICLQFLNEPLIDNRLPEIARYAKKMGFSCVYVNTNADCIDPHLAKELDGNFDFLGISLYDFSRETREYLHRKEYLLGLFKKTKLHFYEDKHLTTHYSPNENLKTLIKKRADTSCNNWCGNRMIIGYTGEMLLCCEDIAGYWNLGNIENTLLEKLWFSDKHQQIIQTLRQPGGRSKYSYCSQCPLK